MSSRYVPAKACSSGPGPKSLHNSIFLPLSHHQMRNISCREPPQIGSHRQSPTQPERSKPARFASSAQPKIMCTKFSFLKKLVRLVHKLFIIMILVAMALHTTTIYDPSARRIICHTIERLVEILGRAGIVCSRSLRQAVPDHVCW